MLFLLAFEATHLPVILFIFTAADFSPLIFSLITLAGLPSQHSIKTLIIVTKDLHAAEFYNQVAVLTLIDLSAAFDAVDHSV